jgi:hypothetical protein
VSQSLSGRYAGVFFLHQGEEWLIPIPGDYVGDSHPTWISDVGLEEAFWVLTIHRTIVADVLSNSIISQFVSFDIYAMLYDPQFLRSLLPDRPEVDPRAVLNFTQRVIML